jgi:formiminoglutamase
MTPLYHPIPSHIWTGRQSDSLQYWYQAITNVENLQIQNPEKGKGIAILGYMGDEGVRRNLGRIGAAKGPEAIRKMMGPMAFHLPKEVGIYDLGDIITEGEDMESSHSLISKTVTQLLQKHYFPVLLGGGHDLAYAHGRGILEYLIPKGEKLGIINLDAHFDLRELIGGKGHSGSPFFQLANDYQTQFHYLCLGVQQSSNPKSLFDTALINKVRWMEMEEFTLANWEGIAQTLDDFCLKVNKIYLSIDLDGFSSAYAPGVSAPSPLGFSPELAFKIFNFLAKTGKLVSMDIVELNPILDKDNITAKLASKCIEFIVRKLH